MHPRSSLRMMQALSALLLLLLTACGSAKATPTMSVDAIYTAAYNTMIAQQATQLALTPPTSTPTQTLVPTLAPPPTAASLPTLSILTNPTTGFTSGGSTGACDSSAFGGDVTIPDNTTITAGKKFTKTWTLLNNGTCTWSTAYTLVLDSGDAMGGATTAVPASVPPGSSVNISVQMTAPTSTGTYKGVWRLHNSAGQAFGDTPWVIIKVGTGNGPTVTPGPTAAACGTSGCVITVTANVPDFKVEFTDSKGAAPSCDVPAGTNSCSFTVAAHWDGAIVLSKGKYTFSPSSYTFTNVLQSFTVSFTGTPGAKATATP